MITGGFSMQNNKKSAANVTAIFGKIRSKFSHFRLHKVLVKSWCDWLMQLHSNRELPTWKACTTPGIMGCGLAVAKETGKRAAPGTERALSICVLVSCYISAKTICFFYCIKLLAFIRIWFDTCVLPCTEGGGAEVMCTGCGDGALLCSLSLDTLGSCSNNMIIV